MFTRFCLKALVFAVLALSFANCGVSEEGGAGPVTPPMLVSIAVTPASPSIAVGTTQQFKAIGTFSNGSTQDLTAFVTWSSSDTGVAAISDSGLVTALAIGSTTITATSGSILGSTTLTVANVISIAVIPANPTIAVGTTQQFKATGTLSNGATQDLTAFVTWSSLDPGVAIISGSGLATAVATGSTTITATFGGISGVATLTVDTVAFIVVTPVNQTIAVGTTQQFKATGTLSNGATQDLTAFATWSSSKTGVATISNASGSKGLASAVAAGSTTITATFGGVSGWATLTVKALIDIKVTPVNPTSGLGTTKQFTATGTFSDSSMQDLTTSVTWGSSNTGIATISDTGLATCLAVGSTTITATAGSISGSTTLTVTLANRAYVTNQVNNTLSVVDTISNTVIATIIVGSDPKGVAVNPLANRAYVANSTSGTLSVIDTTSNEWVSDILIGANPQEVAVNPFSSRAYVTNSNSNSVSVIDTTNNMVVAVINVGFRPQGIAVNPLISRAYVTNSSSNSVSVIDTTSNLVVAVINVGLRPQGIAVNPLTSRAYGANRDSNSISVINTTTNTIVTSVNVGLRPQGIAVNSSTNRAYVTNSGSNNVSVIDASDTVIATIDVEANPQGIAVNPSTNRVYVANSGSGNISVIDTNSNAVIDTIFIGPGLWGVAIAQ